MILRLRIADTVISLKSAFAMQAVEQSGAPEISRTIAAGLAYAGRRPADIRLEISVGGRRLETSGRKRLFRMSGKRQRGIGWSLYPDARGYILEQKTPPGVQQARMNAGFSRGRIVLPDDGSGTWNFWHLVYNLLQIILLNHLARRRGVFLHAAAVVDTDGRGYIFCGRPGAGKSTMARLWLRHSRARVIADDRVIVRYYRGMFRMYGSCWHSSCDGYLRRPLVEARVREVFFIGHGRTARVRPLPPRAVWGRLCGALFVSCWSKELARRQVDLCGALSRAARFRTLAFAKDRGVIREVRRAVRRKVRR